MLVSDVYGGCICIFCVKFVSCHFAKSVGASKEFPLVSLIERIVSSSFPICNTLIFLSRLIALAKSFSAVMNGSCWSGPLHLVLDFSKTASD